MDQKGCPESQSECSPGLEDEASDGETPALVDEPSSDEGEAVISIMMKAPRGEDLHRLVTAISQRAASRCKGVKVIVESGACDHVMPKDMVKDAPVERGEAFGVNYVGADGGTFPNLGQQKLCLAINGIRAATTFQLADIQKPVLSSSRLTSNGCGAPSPRMVALSPRRQARSLISRSMVGYMCSLLM